MKLLKPLILFLLSGSGVGLADTTAPAPATSVDALKKAPIQNIFPNAYGELLIRQYAEKKGNHETPSMQMRYTLGSTFFNNKLDSHFVFGLIKKPDTTVVHQRSTRFESYLTAYENPNFSFQPYTEIMLPYTDVDKNKNYGTNGIAGVQFSVKFPTITEYGKFTFNTALALNASFGSRPGPDKVSIHDDGGPIGDSAVSHYSLSITPEPDKSYKTYQTTSTLNREFAIGGSYEPALVKGLSLGFLSWHYNKYVPIMEVDKDNKTVRVRRKGRFDAPVYQNNYSHEQQFEVKYSISPSLYVMNDFYLRDKVEGKVAYMNMVSINTSLF